MLFVKRIVLKNYFCFVGEHSVELGEGVYAVTARHENDDGRSNWLGKSTLLSAIPFVLFGWHSARTEDEWITDGQAEGRVELHLSDGTVIKRERRRGKSTQLSVEVIGTQANQQSAEQVIAEKIGVGEKDSFNTWFFRQKAMAEFVKAAPADRMRIVSAWFKLGGLQACADRIGQKLSALFDEELKRTHRAEFVREQLAAALAKYGAAQPEALHSLIHEAKVSAEAQTIILNKAQQDNARVVEWKLAQGAADEFVKVVEHGKALKSQLSDEVEKAIADGIATEERVCDESAASWSACEKRVAELTVVAAGEFDGSCPLVKIDCPAKKKINDMRAQSREQRDEAVLARDGVRTTLTTHRDELSRLRSRSNEFQRGRATLEELKRRAVELREKAKLAKGPAPEVPNLAEAMANANQAAVVLAEVNRAFDEMKVWQAELVQIDEQRVAAADDLAVYQYAHVVFGRGGAQRLVAEGALAQIQQDANLLLSEAGIDLEIEVLWSREASGLATHCDGCGSPFPASQKVKVCARCNAQRGPKTVDKLDLELSDRSGAAEDLAGVAFQLAASAWLRAERASAWSVCCIDEPFGALDETNRRALATHFAALLRSRFGFAQAFIVAHDRGIMDGLPNRVEIIGTDGGSKFVA